MVGHTHEDVDQFFSRISVKCSQQAALTLPDLQEIIQTATYPAPETSHLNAIFDFRGLASTSDIYFKDIMDKHMFVFKKTSSSKVTMKYKNWPLDREEARVEEITQFVPDLKTPSVWSDQRDDFTTLVRKMRANLPKWQTPGRFGEADRTWWASYLDRLETHQSVPNIPRIDLFPKFKV